MIMYDPSTQYCSFIWMTLVILDLQAACSTQHMVFWIKRMTCFFSPTFFVFSRFPQTLCCNLKPLKRRWTSFILPRHLHHQKALVLLLYQVPTSFNHQCDRMPWLTSRSNASMNIRGAAAKLTGCFFVVTLMPYDSRGDLLKASVMGKCGTSPFAVGFHVVGMNLSCSLAWLRCEGSWWTSFMWFIATRTIILWDFARAFFFFQCFSVNFKRQWLWLWIVFFCRNGSSSQNKFRICTCHLARSWKRSPQQKGRRWEERKWKWGETFDTKTFGGCDCITCACCMTPW